MQKERRPQRQLNQNWNVVSNSSATTSGPGCAFECIYCNQEGLDNDPSGKKNTPYITTTVDGGISLNDKVYVGPKLIMEIGQSDLVAELAKFPYYDRNQTLIVRNFSEPALGWSQSLDLAQGLLDKLDHQGPIMFITKGKIDQTNVARARNMVESGGKLLFVVTNAGNPKQVEKAPRQGRIETAKLLSGENIPVILSMRPMIVGVNTDPETIETNLAEMSPYITAATVGGLFVYDFTVGRFRNIGIELSDFYKNRSPFLENKLLPDYVPSLVRRIAKDIGVAAPIYDHTTCATAFVVQKRYGIETHDRLAHWSGQTPQFSECNTYCPMVQRRLCVESSQQDYLKAIARGNDELERLGYDYKLTAAPNRKGTLLIKDGDLHLSELFFIMEKTGLNVENLPTLDRINMALGQLTKDIDWARSVRVEQTNNGYRLAPEQKLTPEDKDLLLGGLWKKTRSRAFEVIDP